MSKGKSGSFRAKSLDQSGLSAMQNHEQRLDHTGPMRSVRRDENGKRIPPLIYNPLRAENLVEAHKQHVEGAKVNKNAGKIARHAFIQFPTDLEVTPESQQMMLDQAVEFVNRTHGGQAVFWARIDRDEAGQHGVDVFFAPKYEKVTKRKTEVWVSLTKFGKQIALERFKQKPLEKLNKKTGEFEPVKDAEGNPVMVDCDSQYYQGMAYQDLWFEHLRDVVGLNWVQRGEKKIGRDPDRLEVEEYKIEQDYLKLAAAEIEAEERVEFSARIETEQWDSASQALKVEQAAKANTELENRKQETARRRAEEANSEAEKARLELEATRREAAEADRKAVEATKRAKEAEEQLHGLKALLEPLRPALELVRRYRQQEADHKRAEASKDAVQAVDFERARKWLIDGYLKNASLDEKADPHAAAEFIFRLRAGLKIPTTRSEIIETDLNDLLYDLRKEDPKVDKQGNPVSPLMVKTLLTHQAAWPVTVREVPGIGTIGAKVSVDVDVLRSTYGLPPESSEEKTRPDLLYRWQNGEPTLNLFIHRIGEALTRIGAWLRFHDPVAASKPQMPAEAKPFLDLPEQTQKAVEKALTQPAPSPLRFEP